MENEGSEREGQVACTYAQNNGGFDGGELGSPTKNSWD